jgi:hypothetical protein
LFELEQPLLSPQTSGVSGKFPVFTDHPVTRDYNGQWIFSVGGGGGSCEFNIAEFARK